MLSSAYSSTTTGKPVNTHSVHRKKRKFFSPEEKAKILSRVRTVGVAQAAREAGTWPDVVKRWVEDMDRIGEYEPVTKIKNEQKEVTKKMETTQEKVATTKKGKDFTAQEREAIVIRALAVGTKQAAEEFGTIPQVVAGLIANARRRAANAKPVRTRKAKAEAAKVIPGQDGLPEKRMTPYTYTHEERRLLVAKAAEVGKAAVRKAYELRDNTLYNWQKTIERQDKRAEAQARSVEKQAKIAQKNETNETETVVADTPVVNSDDLHVHAREEQPLVVEKADEVEKPIVKAATYGVYPPEVEIVLLRKQVTALTERIEKLRKAIAALMGTVL